MIKTASVIITSVPTDYVYKEGDYFPGPTKFFFNSKDNGFIGFSHSIGWKKGGLTQYELEVVDPGEDFEKEFIANHYFNRNANDPIVSTSYYITYGIGNGREEWSHPQLAYIIKIDVDVRSNGARKYTLLFGNLPSLKNNPSSEGWALVDEMGRRLVTSGKSTFKISDLSDIFKKADSEGAQGTVPGLRGTDATRGAARDRDEARDQRKGKNPQLDPNRSRLADEDFIPGYTDLPAGKKDVAEEWVSWLDTNTHRCITNYIENITGLGPKGNADGGNVIVLLPSFKHTRVMQNMHRVLSGDKLTGKKNAQPPETGFMISPRHNPPYLINNYLFRDFSNLAAYNVTNQKHKSQVVVAWRKKYYKNSKGGFKDGLLVFQANNTDFKKDKDTGKNSRLDWMGVLEKFGTEFSEHIDSMSLGFRTLNQYGVDVNRSTAHFGFFEGVEIRDAKRLGILKREGLIGRTQDYCFIWGEINMINLLLGQLPKGENLKKVDWPGGKVKSNNPFYKEAFWPDKKWYRIVRSLFTNNYLGFVESDEILKEMGDSQVFKALKKPSLYAINKNVRALLHGSTANVVEIGDDNFVPVLRSNVKNANVLDLRLQINPHYWSMLAGTVDEMIPLYNKRENEGMAGSAESTAITIDIEDKILKNAGVSRDDPAFKKWIAKVKGAIKKQTIDKGIFNIRGRWEIPREMGGFVGGPLYEAIMLIPLWELGPSLGHGIGELRTPATGEHQNSFNQATTAEQDLMFHVMSNFVVSTRQIYNKIKKDVAETDIFNQTQLFYEKVLRMAGPQLDATTYPRFFYSRWSDIGRPMYVLMRQPSIMRGISPEIDAVALNQRVKKMYTDMGSGLYFIAAFEHQIRGNRVESRFRLYKNPLVVDEDEFKAHYKEKEKEKEKEKSVDYTLPFMPPTVNNRAPGYYPNTGPVPDISIEIENPIRK